MAVPPPPPPVPASAAVHVDCNKKSESKRRSDDVVVVNAEVLGTAIEGFLAAKKSGDSGEVSPADGAETQQQHSLHVQQQQQQQQQAAGGKPVAKPAAEPNSGRTCDTSICSSLKDLFVK